MALNSTIYGSESLFFLRSVIREILVLTDACDLRVTSYRYEQQRSTVKLDSARNREVDALLSR